jgi:hypothetical protein
VNHYIAINPDTPMRQIDPRAAYAARTAQVHVKLARLQQLAADHLGHDPDVVHWGHVGDLGRVEQALDQNTGDQNTGQSALSACASRTEFRGLRIVPALRQNPFSAHRPSIA